MRRGQSKRVPVYPISCATRPTERLSQRTLTSQKGKSKHNQAYISAVHGQNSTPTRHPPPATPAQKGVDRDLTNVTVPSSSATKFNEKTNYTMMNRAVATACEGEHELHNKVRHINEKHTSSSYITTVVPCIA